MDAIEQRLQLLERNLQRSRRANRMILLAVVTIVCIAGAQGKTPQASRPTTPEKVPTADASPPSDRATLGRGRLRTVEADQFVLLDRFGRPRVRMVVSDDGPSLCMFDERGHKRLELGQTGASFGLSLLDSDEAPVVSLQLPQDVGQAHLEVRSSQGSSFTKAGGFSVRDAANHERLQLALINGNFPVISMSQSSQNGPPSFEMTASDGSRSLKMHDEHGYPLFSVSATDNGRTGVHLRHPDHERSFEISTGPKDGDGPAIAFFAPAKKDGTGGTLPFLRLGLDNDRQPYVRIIDGAGRTRFAAPSK